VFSAGRHADRGSSVRMKRPTTTDERPTDEMKKTDVKRQVSEAITACEEKQAEEITILELEQGSGAFTDYFVVCSGNNPRQVQAISDEVEERLEKAGQRPTHIEGYKQAEWVLLDYVDFVVHVFSEKGNPPSGWRRRSWQKRNAPQPEAPQKNGPRKTSHGFPLILTDHQISGALKKRA
jgi:ribosome-associated protein